MNGIHGTAKEGADSIVVSGGYVDDRDMGDVIIYTGEGGNDRRVHW
jgi:putative restriction endonuclease